MLIDLANFVGDRIEMPLVPDGGRAMGGPTADGFEIAIRNAEIEGRIVIGGGGEELEVFAHPDTPGVVVGRSQKFQHAAIGLEAEHPCAEAQRLATDFTPETAVSHGAVDPTIQAPVQIARPGMGVMRAPSREQHTAFGGDSGARSILQKKHVRGLRDDHPTVGENHAGGDAEFVGENGEFVRHAGAFGVFANRDAIVALTGRLQLIGVVERLGDPQSAALVEGHADRFLDVRVAGEKLRFKTGSHRHVLHRFGDVDRFLHFGDQSPRPAEIIRQLALAILERFERRLRGHRPIAGGPLDAVLDQIFKIRVGPSPFIVAPRRVKHTAFALVAHPGPGLFFVALHPIRQDGSAFVVELRMRVRLVPIFDRVETFFDRMIRQNDRLFKHAGGMVIEFGPHQGDDLWRITEARRPAVIGDKAMPALDEIEQSFFLIG